MLCTVFCSTSQQIAVEGGTTACNGLMRDTVVVQSPDGAAIDSTHITELHVSPTLFGKVSDAW